MTPVVLLLFTLAAADVGALYALLPGNPDAAIEWLDANDSELRSAPELFLIAGDLHRQRGELVRATSYFSRGVEAFPSDERLWTELGTTRSWSGDLTGAISAYEHALVVDADCVAASLGRARVLFWSGQKADAEDLYRKLLVRLPANPDAHLDFARFLAANHRDAEAEQRLRSARALAPGSPGIEEVTQQIDDRKHFQVGLQAGGATRPDGSMGFRYGLDGEVRLERGFFLRVDFSDNGSAAIVVPALSTSRSGWTLGASVGQRLTQGGGWRVGVAGITDLDTVIAAQLSIDAWTPSMGIFVVSGGTQLGAGTNGFDVLARLGASATLGLDARLSATLFAGATPEHASGAVVGQVSWNPHALFRACAGLFASHALVLDGTALGIVQAGFLGSVGTTVGPVAIDLATTLTVPTLAVDATLRATVEF